MGKIIKLTFLGDMLCQREQIAAVGKANCGYDVIFDQVKHLWAESDYVVGNLETPVAGKKLKLTYENMRFNAPESFLMAIKKSGIDFLSTANNHALDRGVEGLNRTLENLDALDLDHDGTFASKEDSERIFVRDIDGFKVALISCTYGTNQGLKCNFLPDDELWRVRILKYPEQVVTSRRFLVRRFISNLIPVSLKTRLTCMSTRKKTATISFLQDSVPSCEIGRPRHIPFENNLRRIIDKAKREADFVVVLPHIGGQYCPEPGEYQLYIMDLISTAGADLIVANHAHIPQKVIRFPNGILGFCALGDFCFSRQEGKPDCLHDCSIVLDVQIDVATKRVVSFHHSVTKSVLGVDGISYCVPSFDYNLKIAKLLV